MSLTIVKKGGNNVELKQNGSLQLLTMTRGADNGVPVEVFIASYVFRIDRATVDYAIYQSGLPLNIDDFSRVSLGIKPSPSDSAALKSLVAAVNDMACRRIPGGLVVKRNNYPLTALPYIVARFAERMIPGLTG